MIINPIHCHLNYNSENPLYIQLYEYIKTEILRGAVPSGEKLPSLRELSRSLSVSFIKLHFDIISEACILF